MKKADQNDQLGSEKGITEKEPSKSESTEADSSEIRRVLKAILEDPKTLQALPEESRNSIIEAFSFSGPLPPPSMLESYEKIVAGSADRILRMAEKEQDHRIDWENTALKGNISIQKRGQNLGFLISIISMSVGAFLGYSGITAVAIILVSVGILGFIRELIEKFK